MRIVTLAALGLLSITTSVFAAGEVKATRACQTTSSKYGYSWVDTSVLARVQNIAYTKSVSVYGKTAAGAWVTLPMSYSRAADSGFELWSLAQATNLPSTGYITEFVLKYVVNGQTYWDNNAGQNYKINYAGCNLVGDNIKQILNSDTTTMYVNNGVAGLLFGSFVKNLAPSKQVSAVYTLNNWQTSVTMPLSYNPSWVYAYSVVPSPNQVGTEYWSGYAQNVAIPAGAKVKYFYKYVVNGQTYYDNNFGRNYEFVAQ